MCHFLIVNTTQKSVDKAVEQRIIAPLTDALDVEDLPSLPKWILHTVERGEVEKAVKLVDYLNETESSPWKGKILMANEARGEESTVNQRTFVKAIVKYVLTANNPLSIFKDFEKERQIFLNYWRAVSDSVDDDDGSAEVQWGRPFERGACYDAPSIATSCSLDEAPFSIPCFVQVGNSLLNSLPITIVGSATRMATPTMMAINC
jgi:hypothetical protein